MDLNHTTQILMQNKKLIESYIQFFATPNQKIENLNNLLDSQVIFSGPLGNFTNAESFLSDVQRNRLQIQSINIHQIITEGERACALYEITSKDTDLGTMLVSEWYKMKNDRITSIFSVYDATTVNSAFSRI